MNADILDDKHLRLWGIPISVIALLMSQMPIYFPGRYDLLWKYILISVIYTGLLWELSRWVLIRIRRRLPQLEQTRRRILTMLGVFTVLVGIGQAVITGVIVALNLEAPSWISAQHTWLINFGASLFFVMLLAGIYEAKYFFAQYRTAVQKTEHLKTRQTQQKLEALKHRVNPHFLFNALTTLSALIGEDAPAAERFVDELSKVYRYLLRAGRQPEVSLGEELQFAESYGFLLKNRFSEQAFSLQLPVLSAAEAGLTLPALTLQNAIDYLVRTQNTPLYLQITLRQPALVISCLNRPKTLSVEVADQDWRHLQAHGVKVEPSGSQLSLIIPFLSSVSAP
ncbi:MAG TPA: histidine kinase [Saprospiraceae bacterium]|nr:histidine kinase [Saprospiraceae bacterium]